MTTSEPRVRVTYDETEAQFVGQCGACHKTLLRRRIFLSGALRDAHRHAAECPAFRLARLLRELETLRDGWADIYAEFGHRDRDEVLAREAAGFYQAASDLTAIIDRAGGKIRGS